MKQVSFLMCSLAYELADAKKFQRWLLFPRFRGDFFFQDYCYILFAYLTCGWPNYDFISLHYLIQVVGSETLCIQVAESEIVWWAFISHFRTYIKIHVSYPLIGSDVMWRSFLSVWLCIVSTCVYCSHDQELAAHAARRRITFTACSRRFRIWLA